MRLARATNSIRFHLWRLRDWGRDLTRGRSHRTAVFSRIYSQNLWGDPESVSGSGSGEAATGVIRGELPALFERYNVRSVLDAPCGDFYWMRHVVPALQRYTGVDIVPDVVERNSQTYGSESVTFLCADIAADSLPTADLILCRDCFIHLPTRMIRAALHNFRSTGARLLLLTNDRDAEPYHDIPIGSFRRVDFTRPPFNFPDPLLVLSEDVTGSRQLCLWKVDSLPAD